ncbi:ATPase, T2SS/T4P/T4SS family, partial [Campylobacter jejuni]|nr:type II secretion system protein GspE [Campylobacter jejuni]
CPACNHTGYRGRTGIHELYIVDDAQRGLIHEGAGEQQLRVAAQRAGMKLMREDGERWVLAGQTSREEIIRVTRDG